MVAIGCFFLQMVFFSAKDNTWGIDFFTHRLPEIVCPTWVLGEHSDSWMIATPLLNAATYAGITIIWEKLRQRSFRTSV